MKTAFLTLLIVSFANATISLATGYPSFTNTNCAFGSGTSCNSATLTTTIAKASLIVEIFIQAGSPPSNIADTQGDTFVASGSCGVSSGGFQVYCYYVVSAVGGTTSITSTVTTGDGRMFGIYEFTSSLTSYKWSFDASGGASVGSCTNCSGTALTLTGANDVIVQAISASGTVSGISDSYTGIYNGTRAVAYLLNTSSGAAPTWTNAVSATTVVTGIALSEISTCTPSLAILGAGCQ